MRSLLRTPWLLALTALPAALAQVTTDCDPMKKDCPPDPALGIEYFFNFNATPSHDVWESIAQGDISYSPENGATFTIAKQGDSPTLRSKFYFFWGRTEMMLKVSPGTGIISSMMWLSDNLDEVDWEFFGTNQTHAASNYFGKGNPDWRNGGYHPVPFVLQDDFHNYTTVWTKEKLEWWIDGQLVRTLLPKDANNTLNYPQTPMRLSLGSWAGGDPRLPEGTRDWAGGTTNFDEGPYEMHIKSIKVSDYTLDSKEYIFGDRSGSWESIKVVSGNSTVREALFKEPEKSISEKFDALPQGAKVGIYAGGAGVGAALIFAALFYCIRQRRRGNREAALAATQAEQAAERDRLELQGLKKAGISPDSFHNNHGDYTVAQVEGDNVVVGEKPFVEFAARPKPDNSWPRDGPGTPVESPVGVGAPLLQDHNGGPQSPQSPGMQGMMAVGAAAPLMGDMRAQSPRMASPGPQGMPMMQDMRAHTQSPRIASPAPSMGPPGRMFSPAPAWQSDSGYAPGYGQDGGAGYAAPMSGHPGGPGGGYAPPGSPQGYGHPGGQWGAGGPGNGHGGYR